MQDGILVIDKPQDMSSAAAVTIVKRAIGPCKIGHAGTLDPMATGVLVLVIGKATRLSGLLMAGRKRYEARVTLGMETDTLDVTGRLLRKSPVPAVDREGILSLLERFIGEIDQVPPMFSALKQDGKPLYRLARNGTPIQKPARKVRIDSIRLIRWESPELDIDIACSSGTYIRSLAADIGSALGCGGTLSALRRTQSGGCRIEQALSLEEIRRAGVGAREFIRPPLDLLPDVPRIVADNALTNKLRYGKMVSTDDVPAALSVSRLAVTDRSGRLMAILERDRNERRYRYLCNWT
uniref:tRNA pseudouridine synthase B n=1 Tax=Desulfatirhabdium butyrativorans TaxID=340467 RepID=A0A7C4MMX2_9BACT